jgi:hypothetical protein
MTQTVERIEGDPAITHADERFAAAVRRYLLDYRRSDLWELRYLLAHGHSVEAIFDEAAAMARPRKPKPSLYAVRRSLEGGNGRVG